VKFHGILTIQDPDKLGDTVEVAGVDLARLRERSIVTLDFKSEVPDVVGCVTAVQTVLDPSTEPDEELRKIADGRPFIKVEVDIPGLERSKGRELLRALTPAPAGFGLSGAFSFGIGGTVLERDGKTVKRCSVNQVSIVQHGVHAAQRVIPGPLKTS
jgi:hypothetical protein